MPFGREPTGSGLHVVNDRDRGSLWTDQPRSGRHTLARPAVVAAVAEFSAPESRDWDPILTVGVDVHSQGRSLLEPDVVAFSVADPVQSGSAVGLEDSETVVAANDNAAFIQEADRYQPSDRD